MSDQETRLRELLERMAGEVDAPPRMSRRTARRAGRGALATLVTGLAAVAAVAIGLAVGLPALLGHERPRIPGTTGPPTITPSPSGTTASPTPAGTASKVFTAVAFVDAQHGWMADPDGILATSDGGATWNRQYTAKVDITSFDFLDATHGWAVASGGLLRTSDGSTWEPIPASGAQPSSSVDFVSPSTGWGVEGSANELLRTDDGGVSWTAVRGEVGSACLADETTGYATSGGGELAAREVLKTTDGGSTWHSVFQAPGQWGGAEMVCPGTETAWVLFNGQGAAGTLDYAAFRTADGGSTWTAELTSPLESNNPAFQGVPAIDNYPGPFAAVSADDAVFFGYCPACDAASTVMRTTDGTTWQRSKIDGFLPQQVSFADAQHGLLIARAGFHGDDVLLATTDGGATWNQIYPRNSGAG
jgi:photosystem II stability/assembly factor-like uncharacterized protein